MHKLSGCYTKTVGAVMHKRFSQYGIQVTVVEDK